jgi:hypothetical protein
MLHQTQQMPEFLQFPILNAGTLGAFKNACNLKFIAALSRKCC